MRTLVRNVLIQSSLLFVSERCVRHVHVWSAISLSLMSSRRLTDGLLVHIKLGVKLSKGLLQINVVLEVVLSSPIGFVVCSRN